MTGAKKARHDNGEGYALACIKNELGVNVVKHDDGTRPGMHDLEIHYLDGTRGAVEVTTCTNGKDQALWNATAGVKDWVEPSLKLGWIVRFKRGCRLAQKWKPRLVQLLRDLEAAGVRAICVPEFEEDFYDLDESHDAPRREFIEELRLIGADQLRGCDDVGNPGEIILWPALATAGWVPSNADPVLDWLETWVIEPRRKDNLDKLALSGHQHRHLFIVFPFFAECPESALMAMADNKTGLPTRVPRLPSQVTEIWLVGVWSDGPGLRWSAATGWKYFDKQTKQREKRTNDA